MGQDGNEATASLASGSAKFSPLIALLEKHPRGMLHALADTFDAFNQLYPGQQYITRTQFSVVLEKAGSKLPHEVIVTLFDDEEVSSSTLDMHELVSHVRSRFAVTISDTASLASSEEHSNPPTKIRNQLILEAFPNQDVIEEPTSSVIKQGRIFKKKWNSDSFKERVVLIKNGCLLYYEPNEFENSKKLFRPKGFLDLVGSSTHILDTGAFAIIGTEGTFVFASPSARKPSRKHAQEWVMAVKKAQYLGYKQSVSNALAMERLFRDHESRTRQLVLASSEVVTLKINDPTKTEQRISSFKSQIDQLQSNSKALESSVASRDLELAQLRFLLEQRTQSVASLEKVRDELNATVTGLRKEGEKKDAKIREVEAQLKDRIEISHQMLVLNGLLYQQGMRPAERMIVSVGKRKNAEVDAAHKKLQLEQEKVLRLERQVGDLLIHNTQLKAEIANKTSASTSDNANANANANTSNNATAIGTFDGEELKKQVTALENLTSQLRTDLKKTQQSRDQALHEVSLLLKSLKQIGSKPSQQQQQHEHSNNGNAAPRPSIVANSNNSGVLVASMSNGNQSNTAGPKQMFTPANVVFVGGASNQGDGLIKPFSSTKIRVAQLV